MLWVTTSSATAFAFLLRHARRLRAQGHMVDFACSPRSFSDAPTRLHELREAGFVVHEIDFARQITPWSDLRAFAQLTRLIRRGDYDLIHTHTSKAGFIGRWAAKVARAPITVHTAHDFFFRAYSHGAKRKAFIALEKMAAPLCEAMLFVSEAVYQEGLHYRLKPPAALNYVGNGIAIDEFTLFQADREATRRFYGIEQNCFWIGNVGRLVENKGIDTLLRAAPFVLQALPETRFVIAGDGPLRPMLEQLAADLGIAQHVQFVGALPDQPTVMNLMASLDLFILPTRREGLGIVFLEAMALQCPVIGSRIPPVTEVVRDGETGLLAAVDDPNDFARVIITLLTDPERRQAMATAGPSYVEKNFNLLDVFARIEAVYDMLASRASRQARTTTVR